MIVMDERDFFDEKDAKKPHTLYCPHCRQSNEYELSWLVRTKRRQLPPRADERDRAKFAKARSYMVRRDDKVTCKNLRCRKSFEVAGVQSVAFLDEAQPSRAATPRSGHLDSASNRVTGSSGNQKPTASKPSSDPDSLD